MRRLLIIGHGMAATRLVERIVELDPETYHVSLVGEEPYPGYDRIQLSQILSGIANPEGLVLKDRPWYKIHNIALKTGEKVITVNPGDKSVLTDCGSHLNYDDLVFATGSTPQRIPVPGADLPGVVTFRTLDDCKRILHLGRSDTKAVVIGGGLLGLEAAHGLRALGMQVTVVHGVKTLMERQLDSPAAKLLEKTLIQRGLQLEMNRLTTRILGHDRVEAVEFSDGRRIPADLVVMTVGIRPNVTLAKSLGLNVNRGIVVDDFMRTSHPHIWAVGECAEHNGTLYGIVAPLYEQVEVLAKRLLNISSEPYTGSVPVTKLKVSGVDVFSAGTFYDEEEDETSDTLAVLDSLKNHYRKAVFRNRQLVGAVLYGDTALSARYSALIRRQTSVEEFVESGLWDNHTASQNALSIESWKAEDVVCGCMGVSKGTIVDAIREKDLDTVDQVRLHTGASRSCGSCRPLLAQLLTLTTGLETVDKTGGLCACTDMGHEQVIQAIRTRKLSSISEVMRELGWNTAEGCPKCRPAVNYYLRVFRPQEAADDPASRLVNERLHANIQKNNTFSVVPRIYGGVTNSSQLRRIADIADKYHVPMIKITGGQRIDLLGIRKEDLPSVWEDLGMTSGYAYGKAMRTVKTCVGTDFCRFGTQDAIGTGIRLEHRLQGLDTPHKVKMGVSGCPRNCAESTVKDVGVIGVDGSFDMYVGGNGGTKVRAADLLIRVATQDELEEWTLAFLQYYRENAHYLERTAAWIERVGIESIKSALTDESVRKTYAGKLRESLSTWRDPWQAIVDSENERSQFATLSLEPS
ncbi:MAG: nitrite reductase large subunit NirB [Firmicutes bacterium]|uniref:Nitrite reductase large subunit n=1 Tax=Sulfobacillus benefaciens TaxID=453960 RepID=A0A2T2WVH7_9FIRM|nr:nitrite reductase large subunit NirB [Bacillota bacterium]MCL5015428.1 nitrite reductase large subunit NirB [Bacillota bacterium]PSR26238.1 MAG: nitrite reductase large subunit [Sulfobacillus benefaciens]